jgi:hypothetical protein
VLAWVTKSFLPGPPVVGLAAAMAVFAATYLLFVAGARPAWRKRSCAASPAS